jgi:hypothetical protein
MLGIRHGKGLVTVENARIFSISIGTLNVPEQNIKDRRVLAGFARHGHKKPASMGGFERERGRPQIGRQRAITS